MPLIWADFFVFRLNYQMHIFHSFAVFGAGGDDIDPSRVYTAVTENVSKFCDVLLNPVKHTSEQVAQVMRKYFFRVNICFLA